MAAQNHSLLRAIYYSTAIYSVPQVNQWKAPIELGSEKTDVALMGSMSDKALLTLFVSPWARETPMRNVLTSLFTKVGTWKTIEIYLFEHVRQRTIQPLLRRIAS